MAAPVVADSLVGVQDHELAPALGQVVAGRESGLAGADDDRLDVASCRAWCPWWTSFSSGSTLGGGGARGFGRSTQHGARPHGYFCASATATRSDQAGARRRRPWPPSARTGRTWRRCCSGAGRRSSRSAPDPRRWRRLVRPVATSRRTSSSRGLSPPTSVRGLRRDQPVQPSTSGCAPSSTSTERAPSSSSCAVSSSPSSRRARPTRHPRARALVARVQLPPAVVRLAQRVQRAARVPLREQHRPARVRGHRQQQRRAHVVARRR